MVPGAEEILIFHSDESEVTQHTSSRDQQVAGCGSNDFQLNHFNKFLSDGDCLSLPRRLRNLSHLLFICFQFQISRLEIHNSGLGIRDVLFWQGWARAKEKCLAVCLSKSK